MISTHKTTQSPSSSPSPNTHTKQNTKKKKKKRKDKDKSALRIAPFLPHPFSPTNTHTLHSLFKLPAFSPPNRPPLFFFKVSLRSVCLAGEGGWMSALKKRKEKKRKETKTGE